jgi:SAM-dependent methyltransferase
MLCAVWLQSGPRGGWHREFFRVKQKKRVREGGEMIGQVDRRSVRGNEHGASVPHSHAEDESSACLEYFQRAMLSELGPSSRAILDIGCRRGGNAIHLARDGYLVTAFDADVAAIEIAQVNAYRDRVHQKCKFVIASITEPWPFSSSEFDACMHCSMPSELAASASRSMFFSELHRVLRPGGLICLPIRSIEVSHERTLPWGGSSPWMNGAKPDAAGAPSETSAFDRLKREFSDFECLNHAIADDPVARFAIQRQPHTVYALFRKPHLLRQVAARFHCAQPDDHLDARERAG